MKLQDNLHKALGIWRKKESRLVKECRVYNYEIYKNNN